MNTSITVGVREFRAKLSHFLAQARDGAQISITSGGKATVQMQREPQQKMRPVPRVGALKHLGPLPGNWDEWDDDFYAALEAPIDSPTSHDL